MRIERIDNRSPHLAVVKQLAKANSRTLGLFPDGAFDEYAARNHILVVLQSAICIGYLMWRLRISRMDVAIVHVCVDEAHRRKGVATALVNHLKKTTKDYQGISVRCRRD